MRGSQVDTAAAEAAVAEADDDAAEARPDATAGGESWAEAEGMSGGSACTAMPDDDADGLMTLRGWLKLRRWMNAWRRGVASLGLISTSYRNIDQR
jgi:hypothetical protein